MKFENKTVVVTGGSTGIGRAMCLRFAREGAAVVINYSKSKTQADEVVNEIKSGSMPSLRDLLTPALSTGRRKSWLSCKNPPGLETK